MNKTYLILLSLLLSLSIATYADTACPGQGFDGAVCRGHTLSAHSKPAEALAAYVEAEKLAAEPFEKMLAITFQGRASHATGNLEQAIELFQKGYEAAKLAGSAQGKWINLNEKSELLLARSEAQKALEGFTLAYTFAANENERAESNRLIASAYKQLGDYDHAIEYQLKSSILERSNGDLSHYLQATLELAALRTVAKNYPQAQKNFDEVLRQAREAKSDYWEARALLCQSQLEKVLNHPDQAQSLLRQAAALADKVGDPDLSNVIATERQ